ncbi:MAG TPA: branched-chain amino acid ABC transporter ATP-binding protein/permease [Marmoricola sp.]
MTNAFGPPRPWWQIAAAPIVLVLIGLYAQYDRFHVYLAITAATAFILTVSFNLIYGYAGVFSLAHIAVYGIGAYATALLQMKADVPFLPATLLAMVLCAVVSVVIWLPTRHLKDLFLAIATLGLAVAVQELMLKWTDLTGGAEGLLGIPYAKALGQELPANSMTYYWLAAVAAFLAWELSARLTSSGMGRKFIAHRDSPVALAAVGISPGRVRLVAFVTSGALAGLAGSLFAHQSLFIASESFGLHRLILLILAVLIGGAGSSLGPVIGVAALVLIDEVGAASAGYNTLIFGVAIMVLLGYWQGGMARVLRLTVGRLWRRRSPSLTAQPVAFAAPDSPDALSVEGVGVDFGGVHALRDVSLEVRPGKVLGLIGPNGAGKTTLVNAMTGHVVPTSGRVRLGEHRLDGRRPEVVARVGVVRTFQTARLIDDVSVVGNVALGYASQARATVLGEVFDSPAARRDSRRAMTDAAGLLKTLGVDEAHLWEPVRTQPYSVQKLVEIARALAVGPSFLLLDEPGAGLNEHECATLVQIIRRLARSGIGILLIDHNVAFVAQVADHVHVLDGGTTLADGLPGEVLEQPEVVAAYFGGGQ